MTRTETQHVLGPAHKCQGEQDLLYRDDERQPTDLTERQEPCPEQKSKELHGQRNDLSRKIPPYLLQRREHIRSLQIEELTLHCHPAITFTIRSNIQSISQDFTLR
ncbi:hypothetical protein [Aerobium aerolatum]|uniref:hypothetical protein n=1 Tax=Aerobium aerolatum TaxID=561088 RepID=UPI00111438F0|nr:hypothetical protein [Aquamicrobium aerolatum]